MMPSFKGHRLERTEFNWPPLEEVDGTFNVNEEEEDDTSPALIIPLILDTIFSNLDRIEDLKSVRLVCKHWNDLGTVALAKKSVLAMKKFYPCCVAIVEPELINTKLVRGLHVDGDECYCANAEKCCTLVNSALSFNFFAIVTQLSGQLRELVLSVRNGFAATLMRVLMSVPFTKLNNLSITISDDVEDDVKLDLSRISRRQLVFSALKRIKFSVPFKMYEEDNRVSYTRVDGFHGLLQFLFDSSPNLERVEIDAASFYPDFSSCHNLKVIRYKYKPSEKLGFLKDELDISALNNMLKTVGSSVQEVELDYEEGCGDFKQTTEVTKFCLPPKLDCLTSLILHASLAYPLDLHMLPYLTKLKHLSLGPRWAINSRLHDMDFNHTRNCGVTSLQLKECSHSVDGSLLKKIVTLFPSVKKLDLHLNLGSVEEDEQLNFLKQLAATFSAWNLQETKLRIDNLCSADVTLSVIEGFAKWNGVTAQLCACSKYPTIEISSRLKAAFLGCKTWQSLEIRGFAMTPYIYGDLTAFLIDEMLPITFICRISCDGNMTKHGRFWSLNLV